VVRFAAGAQTKEEAEEALREKEAFGAVKKAWGTARPKSVTAERAQKHLDGL
jgi:hypothetical protein